MSRLIVLTSMMTILLAACMPTVTQPAGPSAEEMQATIDASVASTLTAHAQTEAAAASPTPLPSDTPSPTPTLFFPTLLPFPTSTPSSLGGGIPPTVDVEYACLVVNKYPGDNTVFKPNKDFDVKFWIRNIGTKKWDKGADLAFDDGTKMITTNVFYELPRVLPNETVGPFIFDARSPKKAGTFTMTFKVQGGFCYPYIRIIVQK
ncbi:MAG: NBR1-Ig-like domain-containing protein [Chloroflexota bacterium]